MSFTTPCFIHRISFQSLIKKLKSLGHKDYTYLCNEEGDCLGVNMISDGGIYSFYKDDADKKRLIEITGAIDCGINESIFLAIAALRDNSDYMQWFILSKYISYGIGGQIAGLEPKKKIGEDWYLHESNNLKISNRINEDIQYSYNGTSDLRKATIPEIIEHFKTE